MVMNGLYKRKKLADFSLRKRTIWYNFRPFLNLTTFIDFLRGQEPANHSSTKKRRVLQSKIKRKGRLENVEYISLHALRFSYSKDSFLLIRYFFGFVRFLTSAHVFIGNEIYFAVNPNHNLTQTQMTKKI